MKYLIDKNLSLNAKGLLSIVLSQYQIIGFDIEKLYTDGKETLAFREDEGKGVKWITFGEAI